jgi:hypothetical protein
MSADARLVRAREYAVTSTTLYPDHPLHGLLAYAEERLRINTGLLAENEQLRKRLSAPESASTPLEVLLGAKSALTTALASVMAVLPHE